MCQQTNTQTKSKRTGIQTQGLSRWIPLWICRDGKYVIISVGNTFCAGMILTYSQDL